jgi:prepilin-type N-terminal cleavage/methylation domain-containing protein
MTICRSGNYFKTGFSLLEMSIVLAIVGLLLTGLIPSLMAQMEQQHRNDTTKQMIEIKDALIGYALVNGRLPCPAKGSIPANTANAGMSDCTVTSGVVPWVTLGTSETDAWGRRYTYSASSAFITANFILTSNGTLTVKTAATGGTNVAANIPAVFISHGANGYGAYTQQGGIPLKASNSPDEADNSNADTNFVSHDFTPTFDDQVVWISPNILFNRMVMAGKLP